MTEKIFKIRRISDGKFSDGGHRPYFTAKGKVWKNTQSINGHLAIVNVSKVYEGCEMVTYELLPTSTESMEAIGARITRNKELNRKHGEDFANLIAKIDKANDADQFPIVTALEVPIYKTAEYRPIIADALASMKIKKAKYRQTGMCLAFADKADAIAYKLAMNANVKVFDINTLLETDDAV